MTTPIKRANPCLKAHCRHNDKCGLLVEEFERRKLSEEESEKAISLIKTTNFDAFDRAACRDWMEIHGTLIASLDWKGLFAQKSKLQAALVERGLFPNAEELDRVPGMLGSELIRGKPAPYAVVRLINAPITIQPRNGDQYVERREHLFLQFENETALLEQFERSDRIGSIWWINMPWRCLNDGEVHREDPLYLSPERFLRFSYKLEQHFAIEQMARKVLDLDCGMASALVDLALQYAGYPSEREKAKAKEQRALLQNEATTPLLFALPPPEEQARAPQSRGSGCVTS